VVEDKVSLVDVYPTVLELLGLDRPILPPPGRSLAPRLRGEPLEDVPAYFESLNSYLNYGWAPIQGVAVGERKLIHVPRGELYAWRSDPAEATNLFAQESEQAAALRTQLQELLAANEPPEREHSSERELTSADRAALAGLGYTGTASGGHAEETLADPKDGIARIRKEEDIRELVLTGSVEEGARLQRELIEEDPDNAIFNSHYGYLMLVMQRPAEGIPYLQKSLDLGFRSAENYSNLGICYLFAGETAKGKQALEDALQVDTKNMTALFWLARAHVDLGERDAAIARFEEFLGLWHGGEDQLVAQARQLLAELKRR
jgi:tetratricopeptide (TPR) repeat protein